MQGGSLGSTLFLIFCGLAAMYYSGKKGKNGRKK